MKCTRQSKPHWRETSKKQMEKEEYPPVVKEWTKPLDAGSVYLIARANALQEDAVSECIIFFHELETSLGAAAKTTEFEVVLLEWDDNVWGVVTLASKHFKLAKTLAQKAQFNLVNAVPSRASEEEGDGKRIFFPVRGKNVYTVTDVKRE